jgi:hypothetical protein
MHVTIPLYACKDMQRDLITRNAYPAGLHWIDLYRD